MLRKDLFEVWFQEQQQMSRRHLLRLIGAGGGVAAATAALAGCSVGGESSTATAGSTATVSQAPTQAATPTPVPPTPTPVPPTPTPTQGGKVLAHVADLPVNSALTFPLANQKNPGVLIHLSNQQFVAFDSTCPHAQCPVAYNAQNQQLVCPCHGSVFDPAKGAAVLQGPAQAPLTSITITVNADGTITTP